MVICNDVIFKGGAWHSSLLCYSLNAFYASSLISLFLTSPQNPWHLWDRCWDYKSPALWRVCRQLWRKPVRAVFPSTGLLVLWYEAVAATWASGRPLTSPMTDPQSLRMVRTWQIQMECWHESSGSFRSQRKKVITQTQSFSNAWHTYSFKYTHGKKNGVKMIYK